MESKAVFFFRGLPVIASFEAKSGSFLSGAYGWQCDGTRDPWAATLFVHLFTEEVHFLHLVNSKIRFLDPKKDPVYMSQKILFFWGAFNFF